MQIDISQVSRERRNVGRRKRKRKKNNRIKLPRSFNNAEREGWAKLGDAEMKNNKNNENETHLIAQQAQKNLCHT